MDVPLMFLVFLIMAAVIVTIAILRGRAEKRRWEAFALERGWRYTHADRQLPKQYRAEPFGRGSSRRVVHQVDGAWRGVPVRAFGYIYSTGSGDDRTTHHFSVVQYVSRAVLPELRIESSWRPRLTKDIQFESEDFNRQFDVRSADEQFAFQIVHPRFMTALLDGALAPYNYTIEGGTFTIWQKRRLTPDRVDDMLNALGDMVALVPDHVWGDARVSPPAITGGPMS